MEQAGSRRAHYRDAVDKLLADMQASYDGGSIDAYLDNYQLRLDKLASVYQNDESLGRLRYKLYEAQAYIHFLAGYNAKAEQFISEAVNMYGGRFRGVVELERLLRQQEAFSEPIIRQKDIAQRVASSGLAMFIIGVSLFWVGHGLGNAAGALLVIMGILAVLDGVVIGFRKGRSGAHTPIQWQVVGIAAAIAVVLCSGYWFAYRPYSIRKQCNRIAYDAIDRPGYSLEAGITTGTYDSVYQYCLNAKGL